MNALSHAAALKESSDRIIKNMRLDVAKLTHEQAWDLENEHLFDPAIFREIQGETQ